METKDLYLQVAALMPNVQSLGPGLRFVLYLQGCTRKCLGCLSPGWQKSNPKKRLEVQEIFKTIYTTCTSEYEGITISGGEPLEQLEELQYLLSWIKDYTSLGQILYTGYTYQEVLQRRGIQKLLQTIDLLITGPYIQELDNDKGLMGSTNQSLNFLTPRYKPFKDLFLKTPRCIEIYLGKKDAILVGIPSRDSLKAFRQSTGED